MTFFQVLCTLRQYGVDVLVLALGVNILTSLLKKTALKNAPRKVCVFLPFLLGILLYAAYSMLAVLDVSPLIEEPGMLVEGGFSCGSAATLYYVIYEQFIRGREKTASPLLPLLEGYVPEEMREEAAERLLAESEGLEGEALSAFLKATLAEYADCPEEELSEEELSAFALAAEELIKSLRA